MKIGRSISTAIAAEAAARDIAIAVAVAAKDVGEGHITILPWNYSSIGQGTWVFETLPSQWAAFKFYNTTVADGDNLSYKVFLQAGTYTLRLLVARDPLCGIADIDIDDVEVASFDLYDAARLYNQVFSEAGIVVAASGLKTLKIRVDGKHGSATGFELWLSAIGLWRTA